VSRIKPTARLSILLLLLTVQAVVLGRLLEQAAARPQPRRIVPGSQVKASIGEGEWHVYKVPLLAGQTFHGVLLPLGTNLKATLAGPSGETILDVESPGGNMPPEPLFTVAVAAGTYRLEVSARWRGGYSILLDPPEPATAVDRKRAAASAHFSRGHFLFQQEKGAASQEAIRELETSLGLWEPRTQPREIALTRFWLGRAHYSLGEALKAQDQYALALPEFRAERDRAGEAVLLDWIGRAHFRRGELSEARAPFEQSLILFREIGDAAGEADLLNNVALIDKSSGRIQDALDAYRQALELWKQLGGKGPQGTILSNMGNIYLELGQPEQALRSYDQALPLQKETRNEAVTLSSMGMAYYKLGLVSYALRFFQQALRLNRGSGDRPGEIMNLTRIGYLYLRAGRVRKAYALFQEALTLSRSIGDRREEASALANMARAEHLMGDGDKASEDFAQARLLFEQMGDRNAVAITLYSSAQMQQELGNLLAAKALLEQSLSIVETLRTSPAGDTLRAGFFATVHERYESYIDLLIQLDQRFPGKGYQAQAFEASERARARTVLDEIMESHAAIRADADAKLIQKEQDLVDQINWREQQRLNGSSPLEAEIESLIAQHDATLAKIRESSPRYAALSKPRLLGLADVQRELLDEDTSLVTYSLGDSRSFVWLVSRSGLSTFELPGRSTIEAAAGDLERALERGRRRSAAVDIERAAERLSNVILGPLAGRLTSRRLLIVPDGALHRIPFAALSEPCDCERQPLLAQHEIVSIPSASALAALRLARAGRTPAPHTVAVLADAVFDAADSRVRPGAAPAPAAVKPAVSGQDLEERKLRRLPHAQEEAESIMALVPPGESFEALGFDVNLDLARDPRLGQYRILHFATHGILGDLPELSGLVLSLVDEHGRPRDGFLRAIEIYNLDLPVDLVVLSACQTAKGGKLRGEGVGSLTRAFLYAGAERVVVSLWSVSDKPTAALMASFYKGMLRQGLPPAAALRAAQLSVAGRNGWESPYYWAGFVLQGDWK
jgi:CHAT domain-containing protein/Tfp pilus assembly protein PilF